MGERAERSAPILVQWRADRLKYPVILLDSSQREIVDAEIERLCNYRNWRLWTKKARTNHAHIVVTAKGYKGTIVRDQLKANCTRVLREHSMVFASRPVWTHGGFCECINTEEDLERLILYVDYAQDNKHLEGM